MSQLYKVVNGFDAISGAAFGGGGGGGGGAILPPSIRHTQYTAPNSLPKVNEVKGVKNACERDVSFSVSGGPGMSVHGKISTLASVNVGAAAKLEAKYNSVDGVSIIGDASVNTSVSVASNKLTLVELGVSGTDKIGDGVHGNNGKLNVSTKGPSVESGNTHSSFWDGDFSIGGHYGLVGVSVSSNCR